MKFSIFTKLFLAVLFSLLVLLVAMMASVHWSFRQGLSDYLHRVEVERVERLAELLAQRYAEEGSWAFVQGDRRAWRRLLRDGLREPGRDDDPPDEGGPPDGPFAPDGDEHRPPPGFRHGFHPPPPPDGPGFLRGRLRLLDRERHLVAGPPPHHLRHPPGAPAPDEPAPQGAIESSSDDTLQAISVNGDTVGWLALRVNPFITDRLALAFIEQQTRVNAAIMLLALVLSTSVAWLLARQWVLPLRRIAGGIHSLVRGRYDTKIAAVGRDELADLAHDFNLLALALQRHETTRREWIADISHELRTPLSVLRGEIEALRDGIRPCTPERIASLHAEVLSLGKLIDDLYDLSLSDIGALRFRRERFDLAARLAELVDGLRGRFVDRGLDLQTEWDSTRAIRIVGDPDRIGQLFGNLLENSLRYTDAGGSCRIRIETDPLFVKVRVEDSAPNVPAEALPKLFDRLFRADPSRARSEGGAGLGLAICKTIAEAHGGVISAEPSRLGGLCVLVSLPRRSV